MNSKLHNFWVSWRSEDKIEMNINVWGQLKGTTSNSNDVINSQVWNNIVSERNCFIILYRPMEVQTSQFHLYAWQDHGAGSPGNYAKAYEK